MTNNKQDCYILGTRPTVVKLAPLIKKLNPFVIQTGQHRELANEMYKTFDIMPDVDLALMTDNQSLTEIVSKCMIELDKLFKKHQFKRVWVHGDTASCYAGALVAAMNKIELVHNEAGLRTFDKTSPFPEEIFRTQIDGLSDILFAPTRIAVNNLIREKVSGKIFLVGNTVIDALEIMKPVLSDERPILEKYVLATVHRRESFGIEMRQIFEALKELSTEIKVVLPAHPNPNVRKIIKEVGLSVVQPMNYQNFLWHLKHCEYVVSDSGGIQEEAPSFNKKTIILRKKTERPEAVQMGMSVLVDPLTKQNILQTIRTFTSENIVFDHNPFGDGHSVEKIIKYIQEYDEKKT